MAITNHERVGKALDLLKAGLGPFVEREITSAVEAKRLDAHRLKDYIDDPMLAEKPVSEWDSAALLKIMWDTWNDVFRRILGPAERGLVGEMRGHRPNRDPPPARAGTGGCAAGQLAPCATSPR